MLSAIPFIGYFQINDFVIVTIIIALVSIIEWGVNENGIWSDPKGPTVNFTFFIINENILESFVYIEISTVAASLNGLLNIITEDVLFPTVVDMGKGSIIVGNCPLP